MEVVIAPSFKKRFKRKSRELQAAITECLERLADNPRHPGLQTHKVKGADDEYGPVFEAYVDASNRVTFHYDVNGRIVMRKHCTHDAVLRNP